MNPAARQDARDIDTSARAFVLGLAETGLGAVRSLAHAGVPIVGLDSNPSVMGLKSRLCRTILCPSPIEAPEDLLELLLAEAAQLDRPGVLLLAHDSFVLFVSRHRDRLQEAFRFALPAPDVLETLENKQGQYEVASRIGIPLPQTSHPKNRQDVEQIAEKIDYPAFIKPLYSFLWQQTVAGDVKGFEVQTPEELLERFDNDVPASQEVAVQSVILGPDTNQYALCAYIDGQGEPLALFVTRKLRQYPSRFGVGTYVESSQDDEVVELGLRFMRGAGYRGIAEVEFKRDERDGQMKMIEINTRLWEQNSLAAACGVNVPLIAYLDLTGQKPEAQTTWTKGVTWLNIGQDFQAFWEYRRDGELGFWAWMRSVTRARARATFAWNDPVPFFRAYEYGLKPLKVLGYLRRHR